MTLILIAVIVGAVGLDQLTKWLAVVFLQGEPSFPLWKDVLHLTFVKNEGAAFGMLKEHRWVFMVFSTVAIVALSIYLFGFCKEKKLVKISLAMIIGGGIGNMIDRILLGYVIDFIDFTLINFAVFNVADSFVTVGSAILLIYFLRETLLEIKHSKAEKALAEGGPTPDASDSVQTSGPTEGDSVENPSAAMTAEENRSVTGEDSQAVTGKADCENMRQPSEEANPDAGENDHGTKN